MEKYRSLPVEIEAVQVSNENMVELVHDFDLEWSMEGGSPTGLWIHTLEGTMLAQPGDWLIRGIEGELYPCKDSVFQAKYAKSNPSIEDIRKSAMEMPLLPPDKARELLGLPKINNRFERMVRIAGLEVAVSQLRAMGWDRPADDLLRFNAQEEKSPPIQWIEVEGGEESEGMPLTMKAFTMMFHKEQDLQFLASPNPIVHVKRGDVLYVRGLKLAWQIESNPHLHEKEGEDGGP